VPAGPSAEQAPQSVRSLVDDDSVRRGRSSGESRPTHVPQPVNARPGSGGTAPGTRAGIRRRPARVGRPFAAPRRLSDPPGIRAPSDRRVANGNRQARHPELVAARSGRPGGCRAPSVDRDRSTLSTDARLPAAHEPAPRRTGARETRGTLRGHEPGAPTLDCFTATAEAVYETAVCEAAFRRVRCLRGWALGRGPCVRRGLRAGRRRRPTGPSPRSGVP
jgi:hypothetical protein